MYLWLVRVAQNSFSDSLLNKVSLHALAYVCGTQKYVVGILYSVLYLSRAQNTGGFILFSQPFPFFITGDLIRLITSAHPFFFCGQIAGRVGGTLLLYFVRCATPSLPLTTINYSPTPSVQPLTHIDHFYQSISGNTSPFHCTVHSCVFLPLAVSLQNIKPPMASLLPSEEKDQNQMPLKLPRLWNYR